MPAFSAAMDLGSRADYSTLAIIRSRLLARVDPRSPRPPLQLALLHLQRWQLGTPYETVIEEAAGILSSEPWADARTTLCFDRTGLGTAVDYQFRDAARRGLFGTVRPFGVAITGEQVKPESGGLAVRMGQGVTYFGGSGSASIAQAQLYDNLRMLVETGRLTWPADLPLLAEFLREMAGLATTFTKHRRGLHVGNDPTRSKHDDLAFAVALAAQYASRTEAEYQDYTGQVWPTIEAAVAHGRVLY